MINFGGECMPRGEAIAIMQSEGQEQGSIDRWLQGYEFVQRLEERRQAISAVVDVSDN